MDSARERAEHTQSWEKAGSRVCQITLGTEGSWYPVKGGRQTTFRAPSYSNQVGLTQPGHPGQRHSSTGGEGMSQTHGFLGPHGSCYGHPGTGTHCQLYRTHTHRTPTWRGQPDHMYINMQNTHICCSQRDRIKCVHKEHNPKYFPTTQA